MPESRCPQYFDHTFYFPSPLTTTNTRPCYSRKTPPQGKFVTDEASVSGNLKSPIKMSRLEELSVGLSNTGVYCTIRLLTAEVFY